jgi:hypothetical protein
MRVYHFSEMPYPDVWDGRPSLRVNIPNSAYDPVKGADMYERFLDEWVLCDELGLNIMVNEHHATATCVNPACSLPLAILARETKKARLLALGVPIANRPNPVRVAEEMAMIDVISRGRLDMGLVRGSPYEIAPTNARPVGQMDRFWEAHDLVIKAMTTRDGPFSWESQNYHYRKVKRSRCRSSDINSLVLWATRGASGYSSMETWVVLYGSRYHNNWIGSIRLNPVATSQSLSYPTQ